MRNKMVKKIGQSKRMFVEDSTIFNEFKDIKIDNDRIATDQMVYLVKIMKLAKNTGIINERKRIIKLFKFELDNRVTSYNTLEKLDKLKRNLK